MPNVMQTLDVFLSWLWRATCQASVVILLVALAQLLLHRQLNAKWRHLLWLLVVMRLLLPWSFETRLSIFNCLSPEWPIRSKLSTLTGISSNLPLSNLTGDPSVSTSPGAPTHEQHQWRSVVRWTWLGGAAFVLMQLTRATWRLNRAIYSRRPVTNGTVLDLLEDCKAQMDVHTPLALIETTSVTSPALLGFIRPRLLLPVGLIQSFNQTELRYVFLHELAHLKRYDIPLNWLLSLLLILHWFNPLVWYAFGRLRQDRELACDALALAHANECERQSYGHTIIKLLERFNPPAIAPGLLGILETKNQMKQRIRMIAKFRRANNWSILATSAAAVIALVTLTDAQSGKAAGEASNNEGAKPQGPPHIVSTSPKVGETDVTPSLTEITVTFDRDMGKGFSWTGGGSDYPPIPEGQKPHWRDKRTCVLPITLRAGHYYRVGINSTSFKNFQSQDGEPVPPSAVYFTTQGASDELKRKASRPLIVGLEPKNGTKDVDPSLKELRVTFNVPMGEGFSWTGGGPEFPKIPDDKKPHWSEDHKTCILPVELQPGSQYRLGLNSLSHKNFQSAGGAPLEPVTYTFATK